MAESVKFNPAKLARLNDPQRLVVLDPVRIWSTLSLADAPRVALDIGAGTGLFARAFAAHMPAGILYACDAEPLMVDWMRQNLTAPNIVPLLSAEATVPLPDGQADLIYMIAVHHELLEPLSLLAECRRLLRPEGTIALIDWKKDGTQGGPPPEIRIPEHIVLDQLRQAGFSDLRQHPILPCHFMLTATRQRDS